MEKSNRLLEDARGHFGCMNSAPEEHQIGSLKKKLFLNPSGLKRNPSFLFKEKNGQFGKEMIRIYEPRVASLVLT